MGLYEALSKLEEEEKRRAYYARVNRKKRRGRSSGYGPDTHTETQLRVAQKQAGISKQLGTRMGGHIGEKINITPSDVVPEIPPGSPTDTWAMTNRGTEMRQTLHDPNPQRFMPPAYQASLQNMQNMAAFPGQVRGGGMPRRQERHEEEWAAFDARREAFAKMGRQATIKKNLEWLRGNNPGYIPEYMRWMREQEQEEGEGNWQDPFGNIQPMRRHA
jgi:hypothetical protein